MLNFCKHPALEVNKHPEELYYIIPIPTNIFTTHEHLNCVPIHELCNVEVFCRERNEL